MQRRHWLIAGLALVALGAAALPYLAGIETERALEAGLANLAAQGPTSVTNRLRSYDRGWLHSEAVSEWQPNGNGRFKIVAHHRIDHGPFQGLQLATIHTTVRVEGNPVRADDPLQALRLEAKTQVTPAGAWHTTVESPAFTHRTPGAPEVLLGWGGLTGRADVTAEGHMTLTLEAPAAELRNGPARIAFSALRLSGDGPIGMDQPWNENVSVQVETLEEAGQAGSGRLEGLHLDYALQDKDGLLDEQIGVAATRWQHGGGDEAFQLADLALTLELNRLHKASITRFFDEMAAAEASPPADEEQAVALMGAIAARLGGELLRHSPELRIRHAGAHFDEGDLNAEAHLRFDGEGFQPEATANAVELLGRVDLEARVSLPRALLRRAAAVSTRAQAAQLLAAREEPVTEDKVETLSQQLLDGLEQQMTEAGYLRREGETFRSELHLAGEHLTLNGRAYDEVLQALLRGDLGEDGSGE